MKKILALALALMLALSLAACGGKDDPKPPSSSDIGDTPPASTRQTGPGDSQQEPPDTPDEEKAELPEDVRLERGLQELTLPECSDFTYSSFGSGFSMEMGSIDKEGFKAFAKQLFEIAVGWGVVRRNVDDQEIASYEEALVTEDHDTASLYGAGNYSFHCRSLEDGSTLLRYKLRYFEEAGADDYGTEYPSQTVKLSIDTDNAFLALLESGGSAASVQPSQSSASTEEKPTESVAPAAGTYTGPFDENWPENEFTKLLPKPDLERYGANGDDSFFTVAFAGATVEQIREYAEKVKEAGFTVDPEVIDGEMMGMTMFSYSASNGAGYTATVNFGSGSSAVSIRKN